MSSTADIGIGNLVFIGTNSPSDPITINLQHKTDYKPVITSCATLIALPLVTFYGAPLNYGFYNSNATSTVSSTTFQDISATTSVPVALTGSSVLLSCSINSSAPSGVETGEWKLQYKKSSDVTWTDGSYGTKRVMSGTDDTGSVVLHALAENLESVEYDARLVIRSIGGNPVNTFNISLVAVNLAYSDGFDGGVFPTITASTLGGNTSSPLFAPIPGATCGFSAETGGDLIATSSFNGIPIGVKRQTGLYNIALTNNVVAQTNQYNTRYFSDTADWGSGGSCALFTNLTTGSYSLSAQHATDSSAIGSSNVTLVGIFTTSQIVDSDQDGMPDDFEFTFFGNPTNAVSTEDPDGDGQSNLEEYISAFDPTDPGSYFTAEFTVQPPSLTWSSQPNRIYDFYWTTNLTSEFSLIHSNITYPQNTYTDLIHSAEPTGFYRIRTRIP
ncbi:MAG: hypothetical protein OEL75_02500 [Kiritimatiellaceae bacterium]|nr:hypothetical protein [Kiritimatiellaceae bacterium]